MMKLYVGFLLLLTGICIALVEDDEDHWFELAVRERSSQLFLGYGTKRANERPLTHGELIVNKRYVLDAPIQASFLLSSPRQLGPWWTPYREPISLNENFVLDDRFSRGSCGEVWFARDLRDRSRRFVLKRVFPEKLQSGVREVYFGEKLRGDPRIARFVETFNRTTAFGTTEMWLVFENEGNSLKNLLYESTPTGTITPSAFWRKLRETGSKGFAVRREIARQLVLGLHSLWQRRVIHRDVKPGNILIGEVNKAAPGQVSIKLGDFGSALDDYSLLRNMFHPHGPTRDEHTRTYEPPEFAFFPADHVFQADQFEPSFDIWSLGVVLLEILLGKDSVFEVSEAAKRRSSRQRLSRSISSSIGSENPLINSLIDFGIEDEKRFAASVKAADVYGRGFMDDPAHGRLELNFVFNLLRLRPNDRLTAAEALSHPYFQASHKSFDEEEDVVHDVDEHDHIMGSEIDVRFQCGKCGREFPTFAACDAHARARNHRLDINDKVHPERGLCLSKGQSISLNTCSDYTVIGEDSREDVWCGNPGGRPYSEDFFGSSASGHIAVVADGHWGEEAARFAVLHLIQHVSNASVLSLFEHVALEDRHHREMVVNELFLKTHNQFIKEYPSSDSGAAVTMVIMENRQIISGNVGDVRAMACCDTKGRFHVLTYDHLASDVEESRRVSEIEGGVIEFVNGRYRLQGRLALTRAIGDRTLSPYVSHIPHVGYLNATEPYWRYVVIGTDGLFDAIPNDEVVAIVNMEYTQCESLISRKTTGQGELDDTHSAWYTRASSRLVHEANLRGATLDNIGVTVLPI